MSAGTTIYRGGVGNSVFIEEDERSIMVSLKYYIVGKNFRVSINSIRPYRPTQPSHPTPAAFASKNNHRTQVVYGETHDELIINLRKLLDDIERPKFIISLLNQRNEQ